MADDDRAKRVVAAARHSFRVDTDLRPEGRAARSRGRWTGILAYWGRWAETWEFQALIKARPVSRRSRVRGAFFEAAQALVWDRSYSADELALDPEAESALRRRRS